MHTITQKLHRYEAALLRLLPDALFLRLLYLKYQHRFLHVRAPRGFTEKLQWLKLYGRLDQLTLYVDKYDVRAYAAKTIGTGHLVPILGVWNNATDIPFDTLPDKFVIKATHGCGYNIICQDKSNLDEAGTRAALQQWLQENFYWFGREPQYKYCQPKIIAETYLEDDSGSLRDYKFWCTNGKVQVIQIDTDRYTNHVCTLLDAQWNRRPHDQPAAFAAGDTSVFEKPDKADEMIKLAELLAANFPFVRVDLYLANNTVYFGELTFTPGSGLVRQKEWSSDIELGKLINIAAYQGGPFRLHDKGGTRQVLHTT